MTLDSFHYHYLNHCARTARIYRDLGEPDESLERRVKVTLSAPSPLLQQRYSTVEQDRERTAPNRESF